MGRGCGIAKAALARAKAAMMVTDRSMHGAVHWHLFVAAAAWGCRGMQGGGGRREEEEEEGGGGQRLLIPVSGSFFFSMGRKQHEYPMMT